MAQVRELNENVRYTALCAICFFVGVGLHYLVDHLSSAEADIGTEWNGGVFYGDMTEDGIPDGEGRFEKGSTTYSGSWSMGQIISGTIESEKYVYEGELNGFKFNGYGVCRYKDGHTYWGYWKDDYKHGLGRLMSADADMSFGYYEDGNLIQPNDHNYKVGEVVYGIDVSWHQGVISWQDLYFSANSAGRITGVFDSKSKFLQPPLFTYIKATEGSTLVDPRYAGNYSEAKRCGLHVGTYHFLSMQSTGTQQAEHFLEQASLSLGDMPPALDLEKVEVNGKVSDAEFMKIIPTAKDWLRIVEDSLRVKPIIYTNVNIYNRFVKDDPVLNSYDLWIAYPGTTKPDIPNCVIWQFSHHGKMHGINESYVDVNMFHDDYQHLKDYLDEKGIK